jgi:hypothetical protein
MHSRLLAGAANVAHLAGLSRRPTESVQAPPPVPVAADPQLDQDPEPQQERAAEIDPDDVDPEPDDDGHHDETETSLQARARERARCKAILSSRHAARAVDFAAYLAFETDMPSKTALAMLERLPGTGGLDARMDGIARLNLGNGARPDEADRHGVAAGWDRAIAKARAGAPQAAASWDRAMALARR